MTQQRFEKIKACLERRQPDLTVVTDNVHKPHNVSAILRTCDAVGVHRVHAVMATEEKFRARSGIAMGSDRWLDICLHDDATAALSGLRDDGFNIVAVHKSERSADFRGVDYCRKTAVLFGAEKFGVSEAAAALAVQHVFIPMMGMVESYNVSVAAAIVLVEAQRQRAAAGYYEQRRIDDPTYYATRFRWYRRKEADYCDAHGLAYPALDESGDLLDPAAFAKQRESIDRSENVSE